MYIYIHTCVLTRVRTHMHVTLALGSKGYNYSMFSHGEFRIQDGTICQILYGDSSYAGWTLNKMGGGGGGAPNQRQKKKKRTCNLKMKVLDVRKTPLGRTSTNQRHDQQQPKQQQHFTCPPRGLQASNTNGAFHFQLLRLGPTWVVWGPT